MIAAGERCFTDLASILSRLSGMKLHVYKSPSALSGHLFTLIHSNDHRMSDDNIVVINDGTACSKTLPWH